MIATLRVWCWISLKIRLCPEAFLCPKLGNYLFQIQGVSEMLWCIKLSYFVENRWYPNINGVRKYMVNTVVLWVKFSEDIFPETTGFIQARPSQIQGLFKDFSRTNFKFSRTIILTQIRKIWHCHSLLPHPVKTFGLKKMIISVKMNSLKTKSIKLWLQFLF